VQGAPLDNAAASEEGSVTQTSESLARHVEPVAFALDVRAKLIGRVWACVAK
jgi:hypothetical protein